MRHADVDIARSEEFADASSPFARQRDYTHFALMRRGNRGAHVA